MKEYQYQKNESLKDLAGSLNACSRLIEHGEICDEGSNTLYTGLSPKWILKDCVKKMKYASGFNEAMKLRLKSYQEDKAVQIKRN
ncbi:hypothetical protein Ccrd_007225 [Cynara cardunculus var. scolymus]|uniref:Uncharacterized protein n=1 Tax=Cynara cardunculus var. scolymus TaxID=59895 RepID=A0A103XHE0_CYNCS|nr:hypothetical protein Ccrd_007225 [Cynara cardunculus var. scolymus]